MYLQKGEHYHIDDGQDAINNIYASGLIEEINIEPEQDMQDPSKINIRLVVEEVQPKSMEVRQTSVLSCGASYVHISPAAALPCGSLHAMEGDLKTSTRLVISFASLASSWTSHTRPSSLHTRPFLCLPP